MTSMFSLKSFALHLFLIGISATVHAVDVTSYGVLKGQKFLQSSAFMPPFGIGFNFQAFAKASSLGSITVASVQPPGNDGPQSLVPSGDPDRFTYEQDFTSLADLNTSFANGSYVVRMSGVNDGEKSATLNLTGDTYPNTPSISNFSETQSISPGANFTLSWGDFVGGSANDFIQVRVDSLSGPAVFKTPDFGDAGALNGTATSVTIPANTFAASQFYFLNLTFIKVLDRNTTSYPGSIGINGYFTETQVFASTTSGGGPGPGPGDTNAPTLIFSSPTNNATRVPVNSQITFSFDKPMAPTNSVEWSGNVSAQDFTCTWGASQETLTCVYKTALPTNSVITWTLKGFRDASGNPLQPVSGQFTTSCQEIGPSTSSFGIFRSVNYEQKSAAPPTIGSDSVAAFFSASVRVTNVTPVTQATLRLPSGVVSNLVTFFANDYSMFDTFSTDTGLAAAYPPGAYTFDLKRQDGRTSSATVSLTKDNEPNIPQVANFAETQTVNPDADFVLRWLAFVGATSNDFINLFIMDESDPEFVFQAPDRCIPIKLLPTDTSISIPKGIFKPGRTYHAALSFIKSGQRDTTSIPDIPGSTSFSKSTSFDLRTTGAGPGSNQPRFTSFSRLASGSFQFVLTGEAGKIYVIEASNDLITWTLLPTSNTPSGVIEFSDVQAATLSQRFYRARLAP